VRWLATKAEELGVEIYPGFAGRQVLYSWDGAVLGVGTNDFGVAKDGSHKGGYQPGVDLLARATLLAEGARGSLSQQVCGGWSC
jgi:electron-transferring-flavoprotein dehydrogenase